MINLVRACPYCSNVDMDKLEEVVGKEKDRKDDTGSQGNIRGLRPCLVLRT